MTWAGNHGAWMRGAHLQTGQADIGIGDLCMLALPAGDAHVRTYCLEKNLGQPAGCPWRRRHPLLARMVASLYNLAYKL